MIGNSAGGAGSGKSSPYPAFALDPRVKCRAPEHDAILFPPRPSARALAGAERLCRHCELRRDCLDWAVEHEPHFGNYAGTTPPQRQAMKNLAA